MKKSNILKFPKAIREYVMHVEKEIQEMTSLINVQPENLEEIKKDAMDNFKELEEYLYTTCFSDYPNYINNKHKQAIKSMSAQESMVKFELISRVE